MPGKRRTTRSEELPLLLTQLQRAALIGCTRVGPKFKQRLKQAGDGTQVIPATLSELEYLDAEVSHAALFVPQPHKMRLVEVAHRVAELIAEAELSSSSEDPALPKSAPKTGKCIYQFKLTLLYTRPTVWRRIQVTDCSLPQLHGNIQAAFGWEDYHLHQFMIDGERYTTAPEEFGSLSCERDESGVMLSQLIPESGRRIRWLYEYDFGDGWLHEILLEGFPPADPKAKYPRCIDGERACPPEDCGGPGGFEQLLEIIHDPEHEECEEMLEWVGEFDPAKFDAKAATREMRKTNRRLH